MRANPATLGGAVLAMAGFMFRDGQPVPLPQIVVFGALTASSVLLIARFLRSIETEDGAPVAGNDRGR